MQHHGLLLKLLLKNDVCFHGATSMSSGGRR